jgi:hypothetical protein
MDDCKETDKDEKYEKYVKLFSINGYTKSRKLVEYLKFKVMEFNTDYDNPERIRLMSQLKDMKKPFKKCFNKDLI